MATSLHKLRRLARRHLLEDYALVTPGMPLVSPQGTTGASTWTYKIVAVNATGTSVASAGGSTSTGNAILTGSNYNQLTWQEVRGATSYRIYRTAVATSPTTTGLIGSTSSLTFNDTGIAGDSATAPTANTSGLTDPFWTDDELIEILLRGCRDLWRGIIDLKKGHFTTIDITNVSLAASATELTGVPSDCFRVLTIEPRDITSAGATREVEFKPTPYNSRKFTDARAAGTLDSTTGGYIWYDLLNAGSPVAAPTITVAPAIGSSMNLRLVYTHILSSSLDENSDNPIPGESDNALISWIVAWARAKERQDRSPDPAWIATYASDKMALLSALDVRQEQEPEYVETAFDSYWHL